MSAIYKLFSRVLRPRKRILVIGDSHVSVFQHKYLRRFFKNFKLHILSVGGATVSGLKNPNSKTQALPVFIAEFDRVKPHITILQIGEVDTGFVIWYRAEKYNASVDDMMEKAIVNYKDLIQRLSEKTQVICVSTPLPTIKDNQTWGEIANARQEVIASQKDRTDLTIKFNGEVERFCLSENILYLNLDNESLGEYGVVDEKLMNANSLDHHYEPTVYASMLANKLQDMMFSCVEELK